MRLATSRYANPAVAACGLLPVGFTNGDPMLKLDYRPAINLKPLAPPHWSLKLPPEAFERVYRKHLSTLTVERIRALVDATAAITDASGIVLLCYEDVRQPERYCHRRIFAAWWQEATGDVIDELDDPTEPPGPRLQPALFEGAT
jgi:hypothetical protein